MVGLRQNEVVPIHDLVDVMEPDLVEILPAIHALTGCDSTSKFGTKGRAIKEGLKNGYSLLYSFGRDEMSNEMLADAEKFLINCISKHQVETLDELRNNWMNINSAHTSSIPAMFHVDSCSVPR